MAEWLRSGLQSKRRDRLASLWHSALKPAEIAFEHLPDHSVGVAGGGINDIPSIHRIHLAFAVINSGARAGLLESVTLSAVAVGAPEVATGATTGPFYEGGGNPKITEVGDLRSRGVEVEGVITLASGVRRAFFKDPDGNIIGMRQI